MSIAIVGGTLSAGLRRALAASDIAIASATRAALRVVVGARPPRTPPAAQWVWCATGAIDPDDAARAVLAGAYDVVPLDDLAQVLPRRLAELAIAIAVPPAPTNYIANSAAARRVLAEVERVACTSMAVLLTGETGTGKDLIAQHLHARSGRAGELVPINCAAIPNELIEGELFGFAKGAFSGATNDYDGLLHAASRGTVFLDEVDDTPKTLQMKLLRVLEDHVVSRLGENRWRQVDFRVVAATNRDLADLVRRGEFGDDLYQRLAIVRIELPPLRDRRDDLGDLVLGLLARFYRDEPSARTRVTTITSPAMIALLRYPWPGNVRELRNVLFHALVNKRGGTDLLLSDLPTHVVRAQPEHVTPSVVDRQALTRLLDAGALNLRAIRDELERTALTLALERAHGSPTRAA
ncbi:MAG: sigma 54-interacting transcriptional regulator, partial [Proteobacteria bacterium]|nr:sigma 54-interacting transcriptional regulator [Pseudomonadota bacterium]